MQGILGSPSTLCPGGKKRSFSEHIAVSATLQPWVTCPPPSLSSMLTSFRKDTAPNPIALERLAQSPGSLSFLSILEKALHGFTLYEKPSVHCSPSEHSGSVLQESSLPGILHEHP